MTQDAGDYTRVLVVDDEVEFTELAAAWLRDGYDVRTATGGEGALATVDETVDVVLLDRRMPVMSGDEVLDEIRARGFDCPVVMVTAVEPDLDILELDCDDYLVKPVTEEEINDAVAAMCNRTAYDVWSQRFFALLSKKETLEANLGEAELADSEAYAELKSELETAEEKMASTREEVLDSGDAGADPSPGLFRDPAELT